METSSGSMQTGQTGMQFLHLGSTFVVSSSILLPPLPPSLPSPPPPLPLPSYLRQVQDEALRWSTLAPWAARFCEQDMAVAGYRVPANTPMIHALGVGVQNETQWEDVDK